MIANKRLHDEHQIELRIIKHILDRLGWLLRLPLVWVMLVAGVGLGFRLFGLGYGLPYFYGPPDVRAVLSGFQIIVPYASDELQFVEATIRLLADRTLNPAYFAQPGTPLMYLAALMFAIIIGAGMLVGIFPSLDAASTLYHSDPTIYYLSYRLLVGCIDVGNILLVYAIGRHLFNHRIGLIAALIYALSPVNIYVAKVIRADALMLFFILAALWFCLRLLERNSWRDYLLAGFFTGLAIVSKYPAATFIPVLIVAHLMLWRREGKADHRKLLAAFLAIGGGAFIGSPYVFLDFQSTLTAVFKESEGHLSGMSEGALRDIVWYLGNILPITISIAASLLAAVGTFLCLRSADQRYRLLLIFPVIYLLFISMLGIRWERWLTPLIPFAGLLAAYALVTLAQSLRRWHRYLPPAVLLVLLALIAFPLVRTNILYGTLLNRPETRTIARQWMIDQLPADSRVLIERHGPQPPKDQFRYYEEYQGGLRAVDTAERPFNNLYAYGELGALADLEVIAAEGIDYLILSDFYDRYLAEAELYPAQVNRYEQIRALGDIVYEIQPVAGQISGPRVTVIALRES